MSTELMNSPSIRRSNSYRIALRKSGVPKELLENIDPQSNTDNIESQQKTHSTIFSKERLFKKRKQQTINRNPTSSATRICDDDDNNSNETCPLKPLSLDTEFETHIGNNEHCERIVQNGQNLKIKNDEIIEENNSEERNIYKKCKHLFCLFCCCNYCCCLLRDYFS
ncbi:hypothetical protein BLA29_001913 [Euroglyphus maynei]|uniref:Uncharacterized protein n=1 Tax=Euroglyphus maynei TaxID=6958 RepID=A0A1Y3APX4_EURMA|nr:hypothetical protein BLA29_001913 [Euroglyphus maynei]